MAGPGSYLIGKEEIKEVLEVMESGQLFRYGDLSDPGFQHKVYSLEQEFAKYCGVNHALATSSGTSALLLPLMAMGAQPGDEVIVPAYTFVSSYTAIIFSGFTPVLAEIDDSLNIDPKDIRKKITDKTIAIMPIHMLGNPCNMDEIMKISKENELVVIEDCCQAAGASYKGQKLGSIGHVGGFSFNIFKVITAGDGGLITTSDTELYELVFGLHDQGHTPDRAGTQVGERCILGQNFRMNEITGAIALAQFRKMDSIIETLRNIKSKFKQRIAHLDDFHFRQLNDEDGDVATLCTVIFESKEKADKVCKVLGTDTVDHSGWHVYANMEHMIDYFKEIGRPVQKGSFPVTDDILSRSVNISVGIVDAGLGAGWGMNILSDELEIEQKADEFIKACQM